MQSLRDTVRPHEADLSHPPGSGYTSSVEDDASTMMTTGVTVPFVGCEVRSPPRWIARAILGVSAVVASR